MAKQFSISESEWAVMSCIWKNPPKSLQEILAQLKNTQWRTTTVQTYLARLVKKGALTTQRQGKGYLYYPTVTEAECQLTESKSFLQRVYRGSLAGMVSGFVKGGHISPEELEELRKLIEEQRS